MLEPSGRSLTHSISDPLIGTADWLVYLSGLWGCGELQYHSIWKGRGRCHSHCPQIPLGGYGWMPGAAGLEGLCAEMAVRSDLWLHSCSWVLPTPVSWDWVCWKEAGKEARLIFWAFFPQSLRNPDRMSSESGLLTRVFNSRRWELLGNLTGKTMQMWPVGSKESPSWVFGWLKELRTIVLVNSLHPHNLLI